MGNHDGYLYLSVTAGSDQETEIKRFMYRGYMAFTEMEELNVKLMGIKSHNIISHPLLDAPLVSSTGEGHSFATLSSNTLLKHSFKQSDMTQIRALEGTKKSMMVENLPQQCMEADSTPDAALYDRGRQGRPPGLHQLHAQAHAETLPSLRPRNVLRECPN